ncbi:MAG TPA: hypothetical protein VM070_01285 [Candidatus Saccharimonadales bacterium]|nr:hypothetical protein [Candidatus Saccharimonadales bacterium]
MGLLEIAFPYRAYRSFGAASFALVFVSLIVEIELLVLLALGLVARRIDLFLPLQTAVFPAAVAVSLVATGVFAWRARDWTRARIAGISAWGTDTSDYMADLQARARAAELRAADRT